MRVPSAEVAKNCSVMRFEASKRAGSDLSAIGCPSPGSAYSVVGAMKLSKRKNASGPKELVETRGVQPPAGSGSAAPLQLWSARARKAWLLSGTGGYRE